jgi:glutaredoxin
MPSSHRKNTLHTLDVFYYTPFRPPPPTTKQNCFQSKRKKTLLIMHSIELEYENISEKEKAIVKGILKQNDNK